MEHCRTWREMTSASGSQGRDELNLYWPFGFPRDILVYCGYFADAALLQHFPRCRAPCPPKQQPFMTHSPLYVTEQIISENDLPQKRLEGATDSENEDSLIVMPNKRIFASTVRSAAARDAARHLFARPPASKDPRTEEKRTAIELYTQIKTAVGSVGMATHIIRSFVSGPGSQRHTACRDGFRIAARIFGSKRHSVLFPYFNGLYHSVPQQSPLALSIQEVASNYLKSGTNPSKLQTAVRTGNLCLVAALLDSGISADSRMRIGNWYELDSSRSYLHVAAFYKQLQAVAWMLATNPILDVQDDFGNTPLHCAVCARSNDIVKLLLAHGAAIDATNHMNETALHLACAQGCDAAIEILLNAGASTSVRNCKHLQTPLHIAVSCKHDSAALLLISRSACLEAPDDSLNTPLHLAVKNGSSKMVSAMLQAGANIESRNINRMTPLLAACSHGAGNEGVSECIDILLSSGADINAVDSFNWSALHHAGRYGCPPAIVRLLGFSTPVQVDCVDLELRTPLYLAACAGHTECVSVLLRASASVGLADRAKRTALHMAAIKNHPEIARLLLANGADANARDGNLMTPLHLAAQRGYDAVIDSLLESRADIEALDVNNYSALHWAAANDNLSTAEKLTDAGMSAANIVNGISIAKSRSNFNMADVIHRTGREPHCSAGKGCPAV